MFMCIIYCTCFQLPSLISGNTSYHYIFHVFKKNKKTNSPPSPMETGSVIERIWRFWMIYKTPWYFVINFTPPPSMSTAFQEVNGGRSLKKISKSAIIYIFQRKGRGAYASNLIRTFWIIVKRWSVCGLSGTTTTNIVFPSSARVHLQGDTIRWHVVWNNNKMLWDP